MTARDRFTLNPLVRLAAKQLIGQEDADQTALPVLIALDAAKRGRAPNSLANVLTEQLLTSAAVWSITGNKALYTVAAEAYAAMGKACARPTATLNLTTGEYASIRRAISFYLRALPQLEVGAVAMAYDRAMAQLRG